MRITIVTAALSLALLHPAAAMSGKITLWGCRDMLEAETFYRAASSHTPEGNAFVERAMLSRLDDEYCRVFDKKTPMEMVTDAPANHMVCVRELGQDGRCYWVPQVFTNP